jgi:large subunit ribosomal protein L24
MNKKEFKKGAEVIVIAGSDKGKRGKITQIITAKNRVIVEGVNIIKRHTKKQGNEEGGIVEREAAIDRSNVALASEHDSRKKPSAEKPAKAKKAK